MELTSNQGATEWLVRKLSVGSGGGTTDFDKAYRMIDSIVYMFPVIDDTIASARRILPLMDSLLTAPTPVWFKKNGYIDYQTACHMVVLEIERTSFETVHTTVQTVYNQSFLRHPDVGKYLTEVWAFASYIPEENRNEIKELRNTFINGVDYIRAGRPVPGVRLQRRRII